MDNPFASGGFGGQDNAFGGAPTNDFGAGNTSFPSSSDNFGSGDALFPPQAAPVDWSASSNHMGTGGLADGFSDNSGMPPPAFGSDMPPPAFGGTPPLSEGLANLKVGEVSDLASVAAPHLANAAASMAANVTEIVASVQGQQASNVVFEVTVTDPVEQKTTLGSHITYKVNVKTSLPQYQWREFSQIHRYSDFEWLAQELKMMFPNWVCPPLPAKQALGNKDPLFVAHRRWGLEQFLKHVVEHPDLRLTQPLQLFLESSCETMAQAKKTLQKEKDSTPGLWRRSKMAFSSLDKKYADPELEAQKAAVQTLQNALNRLVTYTGRLPPLTRQTSATQAEISANLTQFSETQDSSTAKMATHAANHYNRIGAITQDFALAEAQALHEVLNYQVGLLEACADVFDGRKTCAMTTQSYQSSVDSANAEYVKYKDNPSKASKAQKAHANYLEASEKLQTQQGLYEKYMSSLPVELARFEETRKKEFMHSMIQSAEVNLEYHQRMAEEWRAHVAQLKSEISTTL